LAVVVSLDQVAQHTYVEHIIKLTWML